MSLITSHCKIANIHSTVNSLKADELQAFVLKLFVIIWFILPNKKTNATDIFTSSVAIVPSGTPETV